uniref:RRM domain-containing protein n=1 Tax=Noctiluca scintillans TaxID=2966 RepID=A0A7S0ZT07_NOCSC
METALDIAHRCANIVLHPGHFGEATCVEQVIDECAVNPGVHVLFIWINGSSASLLDTSERSCSPGDLQLNFLLNRLDRLPQPIIGFCDNWVDHVGVHTLAACDLVLSTRGAQFQVESQNIHANRAFKVGLVDSLVEDKEALLSAHGRLSEHMGRCSWPILKLAKTTLRNTRSSLLDMSFEADKVVPSPFPIASAESEPAKVHLFVPPRGLSLPEQGGVQSAGGAQVGKHGYVDNTKSSRGTPKKTDLISQYSAHHGPITTLMVQNIPCRITQEQLIDVIVDLGFGEKYDFLYLPTCSRSSMTGRSNLGYGFINFSEPEDAASFSRVFTNYLFEGTRSKKVSTVKPAHIQGLANNIHHFSRLSEKNRSRGPVIRVKCGSEPGA